MFELNILKYLLKPLIEFLEEENGEEIYQYLYFERSGVESDFDAALSQGNHNITIVGKPGMGKTSFIHYMFIKLKKRGDIYPIILDYRKLSPRRPDSLLSIFVNEARNYFHEIGYPANELTVETTIANCLDHSIIIQRHLAAIPKSSLTKKMVLFLDDLDYAEDQFMVLLKDYFLPYAQTDKASLILSVRPPLLNTIKRYDQLRQHYHIYPREIMIPDENLEHILSNRLKTVLEKEEAQEEAGVITNRLHRILKALKPSTDDLIISKIRSVHPEYTSTTLKLPFDSNFYSKLRSITYSNLRLVEELLPEMIEWEYSNPISLNSDFYNALIHIAIKKPHILLDLVTVKTRDRKKKLNGNSVLQNVLEYFFFEEAVTDFFYEEMASFGISKELADGAIKELVDTPYSMIVADFVYLKDNSDVKCLVPRYKINKKGIQYIENILQNALYYDLEYDYDLEHQKSLKYTRTTRSYYEEQSSKDRPRNR